VKFCLDLSQAMDVALSLGFGFGKIAKATSASP